MGSLFTGKLFSKIYVCQAILISCVLLHLILRQHWKAMTSVNELIAIVPVILNLKGNIEMNLSARLGTASNLGDLDTPSIRNVLIFGNLALLQVQAAVVSFIAACLTYSLRRPRPTPILAGVPKSGFSEYVPRVIAVLPSPYYYTCCIDSWCSYPRPCQLPASPQFYWARLCVSSLFFAENSVVTLVRHNFLPSLRIGLCLLCR